MSSRSTDPRDEAVVRDRFRREAETVAPRPDALARFLAAVEEREAGRRSQRGLRGMVRSLPEQMRSRSARAALALVMALLVLVFGTVGRPVAAAIAGGVRAAAHAVGARVREGGDGDGATTPTAMATPAANPVATSAPAQTSARPLPTAPAFRDPAGRFSFRVPPGWSVQ